MFVDKFKTSKQLEVSKAIKLYVAKHYDMDTFSKIESLCNELEFSRNSAIKVCDFDKSYESMEKAKNIIIDYLRLLNAVRQRMNFGNDDQSVKLNFSWNDVLKDSNYGSYQYAHEYYNNLFMGKSVTFQDSDESLKNGVKSFNNAAWLFDKIKQELPSQLAAKDIQPDLSSSYLTYGNSFLITQSQALIFEISKRKNMSSELQAQVSRGIFDLLSSCLTFANEGLKSYSDSLLKTYLNNRRFWYFSISCLKMREFTEIEEFKTKGTGYGKMISYTSLAKDSLSSGVKDIDSLKKFISVEEYTNKLKELENEIVVMNEKNKKIYYDSVPNPTSLPKIEKKIMANPTAIKENLTSCEQYYEILKDLVPKEVRTLVNAHQEKMLAFVSEKLNDLENECKIDKFLLENNLPGNLENSICQDQLSNYLWDKISEIQQKGCSSFLNSMIQNTEILRDETFKKAQEIGFLLRNEEDQDNKFRQMYGNRWTRTPSSIVNLNYVNSYTSTISKIEAAKKFDEQIQSSIKENYKNFETLSLNKQQIEKKIPIKSDGKSYEEVTEAKDLKVELDNLISLKQKNKALIENIFKCLSEDNNIPIFLEIIRKKASESTFIKEQQDKYLKMIDEVKALDSSIIESKKQVTIKNDIFNKIKDLKIKPKPENEAYFKEIEYFCNLYNEKLNNLYQGNVFYQSLNDKTVELEGNVKDFILSRDLEKDDLLKTQTGGYSGQPIDFTKQQKNTSNIFN